MNEQPNPNAGAGAGADEAPSWTDEPAGSTGTTGSSGSTEPGGSAAWPDSTESMGSTESAGSTGSTGSSGSMGDEGGTGPAGQSWDAGAGAKDESVGATAGAAAVQVLEQLRDAIDDLAERASPTVREYSARIAELAAFTADRTAPFLKRAGEATAEASGKLAERSRTWAADIRASQGTSGAAATPSSTEASGATESPSTEESTDAPMPTDSGAAAPDEHGSGMG